VGAVGLPVQILAPLDDVRGPRRGGQFRDTGHRDHQPLPDIDAGGIGDVVRRADGFHTHAIMPGDAE